MIRTKRKQKIELVARPGQDLQLVLDLGRPLRVLLHVIPVLFQPLLHRLDTVFLVGQVGAGVPVL